MVKRLFLFIHGFLLLGCGLLNTQQTATNAVHIEQPNLIRDCPEELIRNRMPMVSKEPSALPRNYYIYKGKRHEIAEFDSAWVKANCQVKITEVQ